MHGTIIRRRLLVPAPLTTDEEARLAVLAKAIKLDHAETLKADAEVEAGVRRSLRYAIKCGERLIEAKAILGHGRYLPWLKTIGIPERTASRYTHKAENKETIIAQAKSAKLADLTERVTTRLLKAEPSVEYWTPKRYVEMVRRVLGHIDTDPASCAGANDIVKADRFFDKEQDGLKQEWRGRVFCNPPYCGKAGDFVAKGFAEYRKGRATAVIFLLNGYNSDVGWFQSLWDEGVICFPSERIDYYSAREGKHLDNHVCRASTGCTPQNSIFVYLGPDPARFAAEFGKLGVVTARWGKERPRPGRV